MKKDSKENKSLASSQAVDLVLGESNGTKIYSHAVFYQCALPVRALPKEESFYQVQHGNTSLIIQSGVLTSKTGKAHKMEVPAGAKARLLFPYIIDQAKRTGNPTIDMGANLHQFMIQNKIPVAGSNAKEITQAREQVTGNTLSISVTVAKELAPV